MQTQDITTPLVSVWMITYNHEPFIAQAIESVLMQKTNFPFELVIGEDCSTDNTAAIVKEYADKYPHIIKARFNQPNLGMIPNMIKTLEECTGKYIAMLEGDDYWINDQKLQKQVEFLEVNPSFSVIYANENTNTTSNISKYINKKSPYTFTLIDSCQKKQGSTLTMLFRNNYTYLKLLKSLLSYNSKQGDWQLECILTLWGKGYYNPEIVAFYRRHPTGQSQIINPEDYFFSRIDFLEKIITSQLHIDKTIIKSLLSRLYLLEAIYNFQKNNKNDGWISIKNSGKYIESLFALSLRKNCISDFRIRTLILPLIKSIIKSVISR